jgi:hypothetical protein
MLRIGPISHQRIGQLLQRFSIWRLGFGGYRGEIGIGLVRSWRRRTLLRDLAALLAMPPVYRIHPGQRRTTTQQPASGGQRSNRTLHNRSLYASLPLFFRTPSLRASFADHHMLVPLSANRRSV